MIDRFPGHLASCGIRTRHDFACTCGGPWSPPARERVEAEYGGNPYPATAGFRGYEDDTTHDDECTQGDGEPGSEYHSRDFRERAADRLVFAARQMLLALGPDRFRTESEKLGIAIGVFEFTRRNK